MCPAHRGGGDSLGAPGLTLKEDEVASAAERWRIEMRGKEMQTARLNAKEVVSANGRALAAKVLFLERKRLYLRLKLAAGVFVPGGGGGVSSSPPQRCSG